MSESKLKRDLADPQEYTVGVKFGWTIKQFIDNDQSARADGQGSSVRPHIRRAHPHLYMVGPERKKPVIRYLLPTPVNMKDLPPEVDVATVHRVV